MKLTRREMLKLGAGAGVALAAGWRPLRGDGRAGPRQETELLTKPIPSSGEEIPVVGVGTRNYRVDLEAGDLTSYRETLRVFHQGGARIVDTAPGYGNSESVLGRLLTELEIRQDMFLATKVDREGREAGIERMDDSFRKLRTDHIELMQVHNLRDAETQLDTIRAWKDRGRFGYVGVTTSSERQYERLARLMSTQELDFIQVDYSLGNRSAARRILPLAADRGLAVLVNLPFGRGRLFQAVGDRPLPDWAAQIDSESWAQLFLKYVVSHPSVTCAIPGTTKPHHAADNTGAARGRLPDAALRRRMEDFFDAL